MSLSPSGRYATAAAWLLALLAGCGGGSEPSIPTEIAVAPRQISFTAIGQTEQLTVAAIDHRGDSVDQSEVEWISSDQAVAAVSSEGLVTATGQGSTEVIAAVGALEDTVRVVVTQTVVTFEIASGNTQSGVVGEPLAQPLVVRALDALGNPISALPVNFTVTEGGGSVQPTSTSTGLDGTASTAYTLGGAPGSAQQVTASATGTDFSVSFAAAATSAFDIIIRYQDTPTAAQRQAFASAEARWESIISADLVAGQVRVPAGGQGACRRPDFPAVDEQVDDLLIYVFLEPIDGPGIVLAAAGPCIIRNAGLLPVLGLMLFDTDDLDRIEEVGVLTDVILHEMAHVLGVGTLWSDLGLLEDPSIGGPASADPHFTGTGAIAAFDAAGGTGYVAGEKVPVEDTGGEGTADSHWRETVLENELMTGFVAAAGNPLSAITVRSLADMGYVVNVGEADPFTFLPGVRAEGQGQGWHLRNDILRGPIYRIDQAGSVVGVVRR